MKLFLRSSAVIFMTLALSVLLSCNNEGDEGDNKGADSTKVVKDTLAKEKNTFYKIPSSVEMFIFLREQGVKYNKNYMNKTDNSSKYNTQRSKALNFGIYASDLSYCAFYEKNQETLLYYELVQKLADQLNLTQGFDENLAKRVDKNINNSDSLSKITNEAYYTAFADLEKQDKAGILPYVVVGGWIESVYIAIRSMNKFSPKNKVVEKIYDQGIVLDNLLGYLNNAKNVTEIKDIKDKMVDLKSYYEQIYANESKTMSQAQYNEIVIKIMSLRKGIIS